MSDHSLTATAKRAIAGSAVCVLCFAVLASLALQDPSAGLLDARGARLVGTYIETFGEIARLIAHLGDPLTQLVLAAGLVLLALAKSRRRQLVVAISVVIGANLSTCILKGALAHPRFQPILGPYQLAPNAFPSGHATALAAMTFAYGIVLPGRWRLAVGVWGVAACTALGLAVVMLHRHYPSDVLGGFLVAATWTFGALATVAIIAEAD